MTPLEAETAAAVLGVDAILRGDPRWTVERQQDAVAFPKRARALLLKALATTAPDSAPDEPDFDYTEISKLLTQDEEATQQATQALYDALPDDIQDDVHAAATRAIQHLQAALPRRLTKTTARLGISPPEPFELDRFARTWRVAVNPMYALEAMAVGGLDMVMVAALQAMYPAIYELVAAPGGLLDDAIATMKARRGENWDVTDDQDRQVKILIGAEPIDLDLANEFAALPPVTAPPPGRPAAKQGIKPTDELLPSQK